MMRMMNLEYLFCSMFTYNYIYICIILYNCTYIIIYITLYNYVIICLVCWTHGVPLIFPTVKLSHQRPQRPTFALLLGLLQDFLTKHGAPRFLKTLPAIGRIRRFLQSKLCSEIIDMFNHVTHPFSACPAASPYPTLPSFRSNSAHRDSHQASFVETSSCNSCVMCSMTWVQKRMMAKRIADRKPFFPESVCCWYVVRHRGLMTLGKKTQWRRWA